MTELSVAFVDDHPAMLAGMSTVFAEFSGSHISAVGASAQDIIDIAVKHKPDIIIADLCMPGNVYDAIALVSKISSKTKVIVFTASIAVDTALRALDADASAYVLKGAKTQDLLKAVRSVQAGELYITEGFANQVVAALSGGAPSGDDASSIKLNFREEQIVKRLLHGKTNKEIADELCLSHKTVKYYMTVLMQKLQVRNRVEMALAVQRLYEKPSLPLNS